MTIVKESKIREGLYKDIVVKYVIRATLNDNGKITTARGQLIYPRDAHQRFYGELQSLTDNELNKTFGIFISEDSFSFADGDTDIYSLLN